MASRGRSDLDIQAVEKGVRPFAFTLASNLAMREKQRIICLAGGGTKPFESDLQ